MASAAPAAPLPAAPPARSNRLLLVICVVLALLLAGGGGAYWFVIKPKAEAAQAAAAPAQPATPAPANYLALEPAFVVNLDDPHAAHYLQAEVQLMSRDAAAIESARTQLPRIRNALLMLLGQQRPADLASREGKERLQQAALAEVQKVMQEETGKPAVEAVYFTSFVMQ